MLSLLLIGRVESSSVVSPPTAKQHRHQLNCVTVPTLAWRSHTYSSSTIVQRLRLGLGALGWGCISLARIPASQSGLSMQM